ERGQIALLVDRLDALSRRGHAERAGNADYRLHDDDVLVAFGEIRNECTIDLDLIEREAAEIAERGIAGAEVVERNADAELLELVQDRQRVLAVLHEDPLGDFELEPVRRQSRFGENPRHSVDQVGSGKLHRRQIDRDLEMTRPCYRAAAGLAERPL